uniref:Uncharacterized protein n=1 Tax=Strongyloides papillosus TaxID=174720 RepID=A0A0N5B3V8_STREA
MVNGIQRRSISSTVQSPLPRRSVSSTVRHQEIYHDERDVAPIVNETPLPRLSTSSTTFRQGNNENVIIGAVSSRCLVVNAAHRLNNEDIIVDAQEIQSDDMTDLVPIPLLNGELHCWRILGYITGQLPVKSVPTRRGGGAFYLFEGPGTAVIKVNPKFSRPNHFYEIVVNDGVRIRRYEGPQPFVPPLTDELGVVEGGIIEVNVFSVGDAINTGLNDVYYFNITGRIGQALEVPVLEPEFVRQMEILTFVQNVGQIFTVSRTLTFCALKSWINQAQNGSRCLNHQPKDFLKELQTR